DRDLDEPRLIAPAVGGRAGAGEGAVGIRVVAGGDLGGRAQVGRVGEGGVVDTAVGVNARVVAGEIGARAGAILHRHGVIEDAPGWGGRAEQEGGDGRGARGLARGGRAPAVVRTRVRGGHHGAAPPGPGGYGPVPRGPPLPRSVRVLLRVVN